MATVPDGEVCVSCGAADAELRRQHAKMIESSESRYSTMQNQMNQIKHERDEARMEARLANERIKTIKDIEPLLNLESGDPDAATYAQIRETLSSLQMKFARCSSRTARIPFFEDRNKEFRRENKELKEQLIYKDKISKDNKEQQKLIDELMAKINLLERDKKELEKINQEKTKEIIRNEFLAKLNEIQRQMQSPEHSYTKIMSSYAAGHKRTQSELKEKSRLLALERSKVNELEDKLTAVERKCINYEQSIKIEVESLKLMISDPQSFNSIVVRRSANFVVDRSNHKLSKESLTPMFNELQSIKSDFIAVKADCMKIPTELTDLRAKIEQIAERGKMSSPPPHLAVESIGSQLSKSTLSRTAEIDKMTFEMLRKDFLKERSTREHVCNLNRAILAKFEEMKKTSRKRKRSSRPNGDVVVKKARKNDLNVTI